MKNDKKPIWKFLWILFYFLWLLAQPLRYQTYGKIHVLFLVGMN